MMSEYDVSLMKQRIRDLKKEQKLTNEELAAKSGIALGTLNKLLGTETKEPQIGTIIKLATALGSTPNYVIYGATKSPTVETVSDDDLDDEFMRQFARMDAQDQKAIIDYMAFLTQRRNT